MANREHELIDRSVPIEEIELAMNRIRTGEIGCPDSVLKRLGFALGLIIT